MQKFNDLKISRKLFILFLIGSLSLIGMGVHSVSKLNETKGYWNQYHQTIFIKRGLLTDIRADLGYVGFIHNFKNYVIRAPLGRLDYYDKCIVAEKKVRDSITNYRKVGVNNVEEEQLRQIELMLEKYRTGLEQTKKLVLSGETSTKKIDAVVKVNDTPFNNAMHDLSTELARQTKESTTQLTGFISKEIILAKALIPILILIFAAVSFIISRQITNPLNEVTFSLKDMAEGDGDLTNRIKSKNRDELGELASWFNLFIEKIQLIIRDVAENTKYVNDSSSEMSDISKKLSQNAEDASQVSDTVAIAAEEMSVNIARVAETMEDASLKIDLVAAATEEMTATISEITNNAATASQITGEAVKQAQVASDQVEELGKTAQEIENVVETITDISEQVNLLALNATIEAARAGDAGKGFAVVANEIKDLAKQTANATVEIKGQVAGIQGSSKKTVSEIGNITLVVNNVNEMVTTIAIAVKEQSETTREIAQNISQASEGIKAVNESVNQTAENSIIIAKDILGVNQVAGKMSSGSTEVYGNASSLAQLAGRQNQLIEKFIV